MITSASNTKVKRLIHLMKKKKARDDEKVYLVEGIRMFREVPANDLLEVFVTESFYEKERRLIDQVIDGTDAHMEILSDSIYDRVSDTKSPQGVLCVVRQKQYPMEEVTDAKSPHILVLEHLQDPGNMGTIFRTAEAAGVTGIIMDKDCVDLYNPKTIRSTMGAVYRMPFCYTDDLNAAVKKLKEQGIFTYAAHLTDSVDYDEPDYCRPCAFLIGNEGNGLKKETADLADTYVKIPMEGQVESLNAAIAATVLMFEVSRQRRHREM